MYEDDEEMPDDGESSDDSESNGDDGARVEDDNHGTRKRKESRRYPYLYF
jgi:hypothetical protein